MTRWLRHKEDGTIYEWDSILGAHPKLVEVTEEEAFPKRFISQEVIEEVKQRRKRKPKAAIELYTDDISVEPEYNNPELNAEASKGLPE